VLDNRLAQNILCNSTLLIFQNAEFIGLLLDHDLLIFAIKVRFNGSGGPEVVGLESAPVPRPGANQVLIEVAAAGVNRPDCLQRAGGYPPPPGATDIPGLEIAGRIVATGDGVAQSAIGTEVCALVISGGYANPAERSRRKSAHAPAAPFGSFLPAARNSTAPSE
jgi:NADPH:quinone reductase-like Zn-dependent oxidoreductase